MYIELGPKTKYRGYGKLASQSYSDDTLSDLKEGFFFGAELESSHPHVRENRYSGHPNLGPPEELLPKDEFEDPLME